MSAPKSPDSSEETALRLADLPTRKPTRFDLTPSEATLRDLAARLDLLELRKLRFSGALHPEGKADWRLDATLGATIVQPCSVTLAPVSTRIEEPVLRRYLADWAEPEGAEIEMPEDETAGPVPMSLDLLGLLTEELALVLPLYPRAEGVSLGEAIYTEPGKAAMTDDDAKPFAALGQLRLVPKPDSG